MIKKIFVVFTLINAGCATNMSPYPKNFTSTYNQVNIVFYSTTIYKSVSRELYRPSELVPEIDHQNIQQLASNANTDSGNSTNSAVGGVVSSVILSSIFASHIKRLNKWNKKILPEFNKVNIETITENLFQPNESVSWASISTSVTSGPRKPPTVSDGKSLNLILFGNFRPIYDESISVCYNFNIGFSLLNEDGIPKYDPHPYSICTHDSTSESKEESFKKWTKNNSILFADVTKHSFSIIREVILFDLQKLVDLEKKDLFKVKNLPDWLKLKKMNANGTYIELEV